MFLRGGWCGDGLSAPILLGGSLFLVGSTLWAVPFALGLGRQTHTLEVKPFYWTLYERRKEQLYGTLYERRKELGTKEFIKRVCVSIGSIQ